MTTKTVLITGASGGIGKATALEFSKQGWNVIATARRADKLGELEQLVTALPSPHGSLLVVEADVQQIADMQNAVQLGVERFGRLDALIANAGIGQRGSIVDSEWSDIEPLLRTNIDGVYHSIRAAVPEMRKVGGGHVVIISSVVYNMVSPYAASYAASKAFVSNLAAALRFELEPDHIGVTDLLVGRTESEFSQNRLGQSGYSEKASGRLPRMKPEQVAKAVVRACDSKGGRYPLRFFDRLILLGNLLVPRLIGRMAMRQYK
jgi:short-subunit dehydrogenase